MATTEDNNLAIDNWSVGRACFKAWIAQSEQVSNGSEVEVPLNEAPTPAIMSDDVGDDRFPWLPSQSTRRSRDQPVAARLPPNSASC